MAPCSFKTTRSLVKTTQLAYTLNSRGKNRPGFITYDVSVTTRQGILRMSFLVFPYMKFQEI